MAIIKMKKGITIQEYFDFGVEERRHYLVNVFGARIQKETKQRVAFDYLIERVYEGKTIEVVEEVMLINGVHMPVIYQKAFTVDELASALFGHEPDFWIPRPHRTYLQEARGVIYGLQKKIPLATIDGVLGYFIPYTKEEFLDCINHEKRPRIKAKLQRIAKFEIGFKVAPTKDEAKGIEGKSLISQLSINFALESVKI